MGHDIADQYRQLFFRNLESYKNLNVIAALLAAMDIGMLTLSEYHSAPFSPLIQVSLAFLLSSASCATISLMSATQFSLRFSQLNGQTSSSTSSQEGAARRPISGMMLLLSSAPALLLDWSVIAFLIGLLLWYGDLPGRSSLGFWLVTGHVSVLWILYTLTRGQ